MSAGLQQSCKYRHTNEGITYLAVSHLALRIALVKEERLWMCTVAPSELVAADGFSWLLCGGGWSVGNLFPSTQS